MLLKFLSGKQKKKLKTNVPRFVFSPHKDRRKVHHRADKTPFGVNGANEARLIVNYCDGCRQKKARDNGPRVLLSWYLVHIFKTGLALFPPNTFLDANNFI